jgi:succinoglycan biosynthesis transport protein ExoP
MYHSRTVRIEGEDLPISAAAPPLFQIDLKAVPGRLWTGRYWIAAVALCSIVPGVVVGQMIPVKWGATTQVLIDPVDLQVVEKGIKAANPFGDIQIAQVETQGRVLTSQNVLKPVVDRLGLADDPEFVRQASDGGLMDRLKALVPGRRNPAQETQPGADALRSLQKRIAVRRAERTFILDVTATSEDPEKAVRLANAVVESFLDERAQALTEAARRVSGSLTARLGEMKERVEIAERTVEDFKRENRILSSGGQLVSEQQLSALNKEMMTFRVTAAEAKARFDEMQRLLSIGGDPGSTPEAMKSQAIASLRAQYSEARGKEGLLSGSLLPGHPAMVAARSQVTNIRTAIRDEVQRLTASARADYERARSQERALEAEVERLQRSLTDTNEKMLRLRELERDAQAQRSVYESFMLRTREVGAQEKLDIVNARIISRAEQADRAGWPPRLWQIVAAAMLLGATLAAAAVALRQR